MEEGRVPNVSGLDEAEEAQSRIRAICHLLMACEDDTLPQSKDLQTIADLIRSESVKIETYLDNQRSYEQRRS